MTQEARGRTTTDVHVTEVDGVPTVWTDAHGPLTAGLLVRVGHADETLPRRGITHLLEHLALFGVGRPGEHSNGNVDATSLLLHTTGTADEVVEFLARVTDQLVDPPMARLEDEKGVLRAEAAQRSPSPLAELVTWRWGRVGFGVTVADELGLGGATPDLLRAWSAARVNRANAVLWLSGPPPAGLRLGLPDGGTPHPPPDPRLSPLPSFPAWFGSARTDAVVAHGLLPRGTVGVALAGVLQRRLVDDLRTARAAAYSPHAHYQPLGRDVAELVVLTDVVADRAPEVVAGVAGILHGLTTLGSTATPEELAAHAADVRRSHEDPRASLAMVSASAWNVLHGSPVLQLDEILAEVEALTPDDVRAAAEAVWDSVLVQLPPNVPVPPGLVRAPDSPSAPVRGHRFAARAGGAELVVGDAGVTLLAPAGTLTVRRDRLAAVTRWDDGGRVVVGVDGVHVNLEPTLWRRGRRAVELLDRIVPGELAVPLGARPPESVPRVPLRRRLRLPLLAIGVLLAFLAVAVAMTAAGEYWTGPVIATAGVLAAVRVWRGRSADW